MPSKMIQLLKEPLLHFVLIGAGLFLLFVLKGGPASVPSGPSGQQSMKIVVARGDIDQMVETFQRTWQRPPTEEEVKGLIDSYVRDEIYYREAVAVGLDRDDNVIRRRLRQRMEFIFEDIAAQGEPTDADLQDFLEKHQDRNLVDPQISFRQVYIDPDKRKKDADAYAQRILVELNKGADPETIGDPFLLGVEVRLSPLWDIKNQYGEAFGKSLLGLKQGRWEGPLKSGFGLHLVYINNRVGGRLPDLKEIKDRVKMDWATERQKELKDAAYAKLKERYTVVMEKPKTKYGIDAAATGR